MQPNPLGLSTQQCSRHVLDLRSSRTLQRFRAACHDLSYLQETQRSLLLEFGIGNTWNHSLCRRIDNGSLQSDSGVCRHDHRLHRMGFDGHRPIRGSLFSITSGSKQSCNIASRALDDNLQRCSLAHLHHHPPFRVKLQPIAKQEGIQSCLQRLGKGSDDMLLPSRIHHLRAIPMEDT